MIRAVEQPASLLQWMDDLADATRLRLLYLLERHELGVAELCDILQSPQSTVSRHLKLLAEGHWTHSRRSGTANLYRMAGDDLPMPARKLWQLAREQLASTPTFEQDQLRLDRLLRQRRTASQTFFAGAAAQWDKLRAELYGQSFAYAAMMALLPADMVVADLGCGTGPITAELADYVGRVIGVDNSAAMLRAARKRVRGRDNVELHRADLEALPLDDDACDAAILTLVLTYVAEPLKVLREAARIVRPGGRVVVLDLLRHSREDFRREMNQQNQGFECDELTGLLAEAGLAGATAHPLPPQANVKGPALVLARAEAMK